MESDSARVGMPAANGLLRCCEASDMSLLWVDEKTLSAQSLQVQTLKPDAECVLLLPGDEGALTGDAAPDAGLFDPGVGEADAVDVGLPFAHGVRFGAGWDAGG